MSLNKFIKLFYNLCFKHKNYKIKYLIDPPDNIQSETIYIIGDRNKYWALYFKCPCGCGADIALNILEDTKLFWKYKIIKNKITIIPSINRIVGCKSHFLIKNGKVVWCINTNK